MALIIDDRFLRRSTSLASLAELLGHARSKYANAGTWGIYIRPTSVEGDTLEARRWAEVKHGPWGSLLHVLGPGFMSTNSKPDPPPIVKDAAKVGAAMGYIRYCAVRPLAEMAYVLPGVFWGLRLDTAKVGTERERERKSYARRGA